LSLLLFKLIEEAEGNNSGGALGDSDFLVDQKPTLQSAEADRIRFEGECTANEFTLDLWPCNSTWGDMVPDNPFSFSVYFQSLTVRSIPDETIWFGETSFTLLIEAWCPPFAADGETAIASDDIFHILSSPS
jgi:hypothetical protein